MPYAIKCGTRGEAFLAQKILFSKGYGWRADKNRVRETANGFCLIIRKSSLFKRPLSHWHELYASEFTLLNMSELMRLEDV